MSVYIIKEDITTRDGALLLCKDQIVNDDVLRKLKRFNSSISIDSQNFEIYNETEYNKSYDDNEKASSAEIIQSFGARKNILNERILERPNKVLNNIIFESKSEPWRLYINALANHIDWLYAHSIDVAMMSLIMAVELGYEDEQLFYLGLGSLLHDIGMLLLPKSITETSEHLNKEEQVILCHHCELGMSSIESYNLPKECTDIILQHHERLDGSGYPKGLKSDEICLNSRIVMIADVIDRITSDRPGKQGVYQLDEAIKIIKKEKKFSPELICLLEKILQK